MVSPLLEEDGPEGAREMRRGEDCMLFKLAINFSEPMLMPVTVIPTCSPGSNLPQSMIGISR